MLKQSTRRFPSPARFSLNAQRLTAAGGVKNRRGKPMAANEEAQFLFASSAKGIKP